MSEKTMKSADDEATKIILNDPIDRRGGLKNVGGSESDNWNNTLADQAARTVWLGNSDEKTREKRYHAAITALVGVGPKDELEGMIAAQLIGAHNAAMECYRRAMHPEQSYEVKHQNLNQANKLSRTFAALLDTLNRHRGKGQQKVTVEHVHVHAGGQAVVGMVQPPREGDQCKLEDQPHAKQLTHAPQPPMRSANEAREPVPVACDAQRPLPDAWGSVSGCSKG
jgi:hypothetical protein